MVCRLARHAPRSLFFCVPGTHTDGHRFAGEACVAGAAAVVVMSKAKAEELGLTWLCEIGAHGMVAGPDASLQEQPANAIMRDSRPYVVLESAGPAGPEVNVVRYSSDPVEAAGVAARIVELIGSGTRPGDIAVLMRTNGQSEAVEAALQERDAPFGDGEAKFEDPAV